jgi:DNA-binding NarL/FixJ family response regulator
VKVFVVDSHAIYRRGLVASLELLERVESVEQAADVRKAQEGYLRKETLTQDLLQAAIQAAEGGAAVVAPDMLGAMLRGVPVEPDAGGTSRFPGPRLSEREQRVLALIAEGHPTREVAQQLCYSERTVKNVLHDVVTKLNARSRSQAVAHAVRDGLI